MRGRQPKQASMLCLINLEEQVPTDHPLREIKKITDEALARMSRASSAARCQGAGMAQASLRR